METPKKRGGFRPGSGRPKGSKNKPKPEKELATALAKAGKSPLKYLMSIVENPEIEHRLRVEAAKAAAPYMHSRLSSVEHSGPEGGPIKVILNGVDADL